MGVLRDLSRTSSQACSACPSLNFLPLEESSTWQFFAAVLALLTRCGGVTCAGSPVWWRPAAA